MKITYADGVQPNPETVTGIEISHQHNKEAFGAALAKLRGPKTRPLTIREIKRIQRRDAASQTKKATRNWRRSKIQAVQDQSNALGLARVYLLNHGTPAMQATVRHHVEVELANSIASQMNIDLQDAKAQLVTRFEDLLRQSGDLRAELAA